MPQEDAQRFLRQLLFNRYAKLLERIAATYNLSPAKLGTLQEQILTLEWIDRACDTIGSK